jgi:hypothetical protein
LFSQIATCFYSCKPEALAGLGKKIDYADLLKHSTMEEVVSGLMERELFALSSDSHYDQLKFLNEKLKLGIDDSFDEWTQLAEICARRNLYVHNGGKVNDSYLRNASEFLRETGVSPTRGTYLRSSDEYLESSFGCVLDAGLQAGAAAIRRLFPDHRSVADSVLIDVGFDYLVEEEWALAERIFRYGWRTPAKWLGSDENGKICLINHCIALKHLGRTADVRSALGAVDWSSVSRKFVLAREVLLDDVAAAGRTMAQTNDSDLTEYQLRTWPLFREFRPTPEFKAAFEARFGKAYEPSVAEVLQGE